MRRKQTQPKVFYHFSLADRVPEDHLLRWIDREVDFSFVYQLARPYYSDTGAPSVDPVVILKMSLIGYLYGIASERKLAEDVRLNMAYLWFLGYDLDELPPDHSILSKARRRFGPTVYQQFFAQVVTICQNKGLIQGDRVFMDATLVRANASLDSLASRRLVQQLPGQPEDWVKRIWSENDDVASADESNQVGTDRPVEPPVGKLKTNERRVSRTDVDAAIISDKKKGLFLAHKVHICVADGRARIITAVTTTPGDRPEAGQVPTLLGQHRWHVRSKPKELVADAGYGTEKVYEHLFREKVLPSIPRRTTWLDTQAKKVQLGFTYDRDLDVYFCPKGKKLYRDRTFTSSGGFRYRTHRLACRQCELKVQCTRGERCSIYRPANATVREWVTAHLATDEAKLSLRRRPYWVETVFADLKGNRNMARAHFRGNPAVHIQALLAAVAHNLHQLVKQAKRRGIGTANANLRLTGAMLSLSSALQTT